MPTPNPVSEQCSKQPPSHDAEYSRYKDMLRDFSVGGKKFGKAQVDCCCYAPESKWGVIESNTVGIIYFSITLSQSLDYFLDWVDVQMTFKAEEGTKDPPPTVMKYIAPEVLPGPGQEEQINKMMELSPEVNIPGHCVFKLGRLAYTKDYKRTRRWWFQGDRLQDGSRLYRVVQWSWVSNRNDAQGEVRHLHLAVTVQHALTPFSIEIAVDGRLRGHKLTTMRGKFQSRKKTITTITPQTGQTDLIVEASNLGRAVWEKNSVLLPHLTEGGKPPWFTEPDHSLLRAVWESLQMILNLVIRLLWWLTLGPFRQGWLTGT